MAKSAVNDSKLLLTFFTTVGMISSIAFSGLNLSHLKIVGTVSKIQYESLVGLHGFLLLFSLVLFFITEFVAYNSKKTAKGTFLV